MSHRAAILGRVARVSGVGYLETAFAAFSMAEYGAWVAILVYAYERGGATESAVVAVCQLVPAAFVAPVAARAIDRRGAANALRRGYCAQAGAYGATAALLFAEAPAASVYATAVIAASAVTATRPAHAAMIPRLATESEAVTALTVLSGWVESASVLVGPALAGLLIAIDGPAAAIGCFAGALTIAALLITHAFDGEPATGATAPRRRPAPQTVAALLRDHGRLVPVVLLVATQYLVIGALDVLLVVLAISELGLGASGAGYLTAAFGAGGVIGSVGAVWLDRPAPARGPAERRRARVGHALALLGVWPTVAGAFLLLAAAGSARSLLDTSGRTILIRVAPDAARGEVSASSRGVDGRAGDRVGPRAGVRRDRGPARGADRTGGPLWAITVTAGSAVHAVDGVDRATPGRHAGGSTV